MAEPQEKTAPTVEAVLAQPHVHGGKQYKAGDKIKVTAAQVGWLRKHGKVASLTTEEGK